MAFTNNRIFLTLKYLFQVEGYTTIPTQSFPYRMGCHNSDLFRIGIHPNDPHHKEYFSDGISLSEYHAAFLSSPIFQMELWLLTKVSGGNVDPVTTTIPHLRGVATGDHSSFGPWTTWAVNGSRLQPIGSSFEHNNRDAKADVPSSETTTTTTPCVIMRCRTRHGPFCDTWWALELEDTASTASTTMEQQYRRPQLVFGTSLLDDYHNSIFVRLMTPLHRFYSRLLLANCKANLVYKYQKNQ